MGWERFIPPEMREPISGPSSANVAKVAKVLWGGGGSSAVFDQVPIAPKAPVAPAEARPDFEERAAQVEDGAKTPRPWAEEFARLDLRHPPPAFGALEWRGFLDDAGRFLDRWAVVAAELGWGPLDVFGIVLSTDGRQVGRQLGLAFLIRGGHVEAITADRANVRTLSGSTLTYLRRAPNPPNAIPVWEAAAAA